MFPVHVHGGGRGLLETEYNHWAAGPRNETPIKLWTLELRWASRAGSAVHLLPHVDAGRGRPP